MKKFFLLAMLFAVTTISLISQVNPRIVKDVHYGTDSAFHYFPNHPIPTRDVVGDDLYFLADDGIYGHELWRSSPPYDEQSTTLVNDLTAGSNGCSGNYTSAYGKLYFVNGINTSSYGIWESDGTSQGTDMLYTPTCSGKSCNIFLMCPSQNQIFWTRFVYPNGMKGPSDLRENLWRTNPNTGSSTKLKDFINIEWLKDVNGTLLLMAWEVNSGINSLWKSNGTQKGTSQYYILTNALSPSTGYPSSGSYPYFGRQTFCVAGGNLYFASGNTTYGMELWRTNGTAVGTMRITDINPGTGNSAPAMGAEMNGFLYFAANDGTNGYQIWRYPLAGGNAERVTNINGGTKGADPLWITAVGNTLFFSAYTDYKENENDPVYGRELWKSDGIPGGITEIVSDINPGLASSNPNYFDYTDRDLKFSSNMAVIGNYVYFAADNGNGYHLWRSDGTTIEEVKGLNTPPINPKLLTPVNGKLMYAGWTADEGYELWIFDPEIRMGKRGDDAIIVDSKDCSINIYPNPADDRITIDCEFSNKIDVEVRLSNILGMDILNFSKPGVKKIHENLNISNLAPGMYIIEMRYGGEAIQRKIIKR